MLPLSARGPSVDEATDAKTTLPVTKHGKYPMALISLETHARVLSTLAEFLWGASYHRRARKCSAKHWDTFKPV